MMYTKPKLYYTALIANLVVTNTNLILKKLIAIVQGNQST